MNWNRELLIIVNSHKEIDQIVKINLTNIFHFKLTDIKKLVT